MLEWYRAGEPYDAVMDDCVAFIRLAAETAGAKSLRFRERELRSHSRSPSGSASLTHFARHAGIDLLATMDAAYRCRCAGSADARQRGSPCQPNTTGPICSPACLIEKIEPHLGMGRVTILDRYPASEAALARRAPDDPRVAERFEIYACGSSLPTASAN